MLPVQFYSTAKTGVEENNVEIALLPELSKSIVSLELTFLSPQFCMLKKLLFFTYHT